MSSWTAWSAPCTRANAGRPPAYCDGDGLGETEGAAAADGDPAAVAEADAAAEPDADPLDDAEPDPLGAALGLAIGVGVSGKIVLGTLARARAKISTKMTTTTITQGLARLSLRGGSVPRYPGAGASSPRAAPPRL